MRRVIMVAALVIDVQGDGRIDQVSCGSGRDVVRANLEDNLFDDCEVAKAVEGPQ